MANTPILNLIQVSANQNQKETTINTDFAIIEAALNDVQTISLATGNKTLTTDQFTKYFHTILSGHTVARQVTVPATVRFFAMSNTGTGDVTVKANGSSGATVLIAVGKRVLILSDGTDVLAITSGVSTLSNLSDVVGAGDASEGQLLMFDGTVWSPVDNATDVDFFQPGTTTASQKLLRKLFVRDVTFFGDFSQSFATADVAATASTVFTVYKNASAIGTITFGVGSTTGVLATTGAATVSYAPGDRIVIVGPASPDATLADISVTLKGVYTS